MTRAFLPLCGIAILISLVYYSSAISEWIAEGLLEGRSRPSRSAVSEGPAPRMPREPEPQPGPLMDSKEAYELIEFLEDPIVSSDGEVRRKLQQVAELERTLKVARLVGLNWTRVERQVVLFRDFAGSDSEGRLERVDLATSLDPAVVRLREDVGLKPPEGWVFVRLYADFVPPLVDNALRRDGVAAVTIGTRYIAAPMEWGRKGSWKGMIFGAPRAPEWIEPPRETISHELAHAYINSYMGPDRVDALPKWFHEGAATYLSGSNVQMVRRGAERGDLRTVGPTDEYLLYERLFHLVRDHGGSDAINRFIHDSIDAATVAWEHAPKARIESELLLWDREGRLVSDQRWRSSRTVSIVFLIGLILFLFWIILRAQAPRPAPSYPLPDRPLGPPPSLDPVPFPGGAPSAGETLRIEPAQRLAACRTLLALGHLDPDRSWTDRGPAPEALARLMSGVAGVDRDPTEMPVFLLAMAFWTGDLRGVATAMGLIPDPEVRAAVIGLLGAALRGRDGIEEWLSQWGPAGD